MRRSKRGAGGDAFAAARLLIRCGVSVRAAKKTMDDVAAGQTAFVDVPHVSDYEFVRRRMADGGLAVRRVQQRAVDVRALRTRLGISQEAFAGRYGLDVATVRNWEQGRTTPEGPAATLLQLIDRDPDAVLELLAS